MSVGFLEVYNPDYAYGAPEGWARGYAGIPGRSGPVYGDLEGGLGPAHA